MHNESHVLCSYLQDDVCYFPFSSHEKQNNKKHVRDDTLFKHPLCWKLEYRVAFFDVNTCHDDSVFFRALHLSFWRSNDNASWLYALNCQSGPQYWSTDPLMVPLNWISIWRHPIATQQEPGLGSSTHFSVNSNLWSRRHVCLCNTQNRCLWRLLEGEGDSNDREMTRSSNSRGPAFLMVVKGKITGGFLF